MLAYVAATILTQSYRAASSGSPLAVGVMVELLVRADPLDTAVADAAVATLLDPSELGPSPISAKALIWLLQRPNPPWSRQAHARLIVALFARDDDKAPPLSIADSEAFEIGRQFADASPDAPAQRVLADLTRSIGTRHIPELIRGLASTPCGPWGRDALRWLIGRGSAEQLGVVGPISDADVDALVLTSIAIHGPADGTRDALTALDPIVTQASSAALAVLRLSRRTEVAALAASMADRLAPPTRAIAADAAAHFIQRDIVVALHAGARVATSDVERTVQDMAAMAWHKPETLPSLARSKTVRADSAIALGLVRMAREREVADIATHAVELALLFRAEDSPASRGLVRLAAAYVLDPRQPMTLRQSAAMLLDLPAELLCRDSTDDLIVDFDIVVYYPPTEARVAAIHGVLDGLPDARAAALLDAGADTRPAWAATWLDRLAKAPPAEHAALERRLARLGAALDSAFGPALERRSFLGADPAFLRLVRAHGDRAALKWLYRIDSPDARAAEDAIRARHPADPATAGAISVAGTDGAVSLANDPDR